MGSLRAAGALLSALTLIMTMGVVAPTAIGAANPANAGIAANGPFNPRVEAAYQYLDDAMDARGSDPDLRLPLSYDGGPVQWDGSATYDNALIIIAYANRPEGPDREDSLHRAEIMGDALLQAQAGDPIGDGRLRNSYQAERLFDESGAPGIQGEGSATGGQAWAGMALAHLAHVTGEQRFLDGATRLGQWIIDHTWDNRGAGGFTGGYRNNEGRLERIAWKSTEHNIDLTALFGMLHQQTGEARWDGARAHAEGFVRSMWMPRAGYVALGSTPDGMSTNHGEYIPEDVQAWAYLALQSRSLRRAVLWSVTTLQVTDEPDPDNPADRGPGVPITGVRFAEHTDESHNDTTVWLEGTAHTALALRCTGHRSDAVRAREYLAQIELAQSHGAHADGRGIPANSSSGYSGGDDVVHDSRHTGATAWYILAGLGINPFHLSTTC